ncbi:MAG TPA: AraC family transcriptional regulator [Flavobacterium sp.]|uniref:AraC family transcriptional regulator n=1 Tax=Flavobacterium sp. TaxID=239 RepID=UPI002DBE00DE|nr:AraC family transcriptional regulator [Flavobacterium sp.]HEU4791517.1 AraC family transcriptional regulator [Flavobacterium sp.]
MTYLHWKKILFLLIIPFTLLGQAKENDHTRLTYDDLNNLYFDNYKNQSKQLECAKAIMTKANADNSPIKKANGYYLFALLSESNKAIHYLDSAIAYSKDKNDIKFPAYAYSEKGYVLKKQFRYREAIDNFILAEKEAKKNNIDYYFRVKFSIAVLRSEELGEVTEALELYKECFNYYKNKEIRTPKYSFDYQNVIFALADAYKALNQSDTATYYNKLGYRESKITKDDEMNALFILNEGANLVLKKNFRDALDSIDKALPKMISYKNHGNTLAAYYYLGKIYEGLGNKAKATQNFIKADSVYNKTKRITPEFTSGYSFLISYFKEKGDKAKQLKYITKYMYIDSTLQKNYKELTKKLQREYDTPHLLSEKEALIQSLEKDETLSYWANVTLVLLTVSIGAFGFYQYKLKKTYRSRFEKIINPISSISTNQIVVPETKEIKINAAKIEDISIAEELVNQILEKLKRFESKKEYLQSNLTIQMLSTTFETNSKYVSKIVNAYKGKTFIQYINDLRVEHAIVQLQKDNKLRKYTIHALAAEFGFNSAESFSTAFHKKTGIKPTYFIKELENKINI